MRTNHLLVNILTITLPLTNERLKLVFSSISKEHSIKDIFMPPLKKGAYCFATVGRLVGRSVGMSVGLSVGLSVCRPSVVRSISFDPFT